MHDWTQEDKRQRERLERMSSVGTRANIVGSLNKIAAGSAARERAGVAALLLLREAQQARGQHIRGLNKRHDLLMKAGRLDRLHPDSQMRRRVPASPTSDIPAAERDDARDQPYVTPLEARRLAADGGMAADARTRADKWDGQGVRAVEPEWLTLEAMRTLAAARVKASRYW